MTALLLAQELFLLAHQEESAKACLHPRSGQRVGWGAPGEFASEELVAADGRALTALVGAAISEAGAKLPSDMGKVMKLLLPRIAGRAAGDQVSAAVRQALQKQ